MLSLPRASSGLHPLHLTVSTSDGSCEPLHFPRLIVDLNLNSRPSSPPSPPPLIPLTHFLRSRLVTCSTCSNHIVLPRYCSRQQLVSKLRMSVAERTFGVA
jgi:hypothetical protein